MNTFVTAKALDLGSEWTNILYNNRRQKSVEVSYFVAVCKEATLMNEIPFHSPRSISFRVILLSLKKSIISEPKQKKFPTLRKLKSISTTNRKQMYIRMTKN